MQRPLTFVEGNGGTFTFLPFDNRGTLDEPMQQALATAAKSVTTGEVTATEQSVTFVLDPEPTASEIPAIRRRLEDALVEALGGSIMVEHLYFFPAAPRIKDGNERTSRSSFSGTVQPRGYPALGPFDPIN